MMDTFGLTFGVHFGLVLFTFQLPEQTVSGLHQIKEYIWAYDYGSCLTVLNLLVSSGSFSVLSQFLPGVKVLIQVASQLGVYLERSAR